MCVCVCGGGGGARAPLGAPKDPVKTHRRSFPRLNHMTQSLRCCRAPISLNSDGISSEAGPSDAGKIQ